MSDGSPMTDPQRLRSQNQDPARSVGADVDVEQLVGALDGGFADSKPLQIFGPRMAQAADPGPKVAEIATMMKDVDAISRTAATLPIATPLLDRVRGLYARAMQAGLGRDDLPALIRLYRDKLLQDFP